tara:strand:- start:1997 stop:3001 length:1005 start_codon:yes stop_codon:yes gene_type:complete
MNHKVWLTVFGIVAAVLIGGAGFYAFSGYSNFSEELSSWDEKVGTISGLERRVPYPNDDNSIALKEKVDAYRGSVESLGESLKSFQRPLNQTLASTEFQQLVKERVQEFRGLSRSAGFTIEGTEEFQLGFDSYSNTIPQPELVPVLDYELEAIDHLLKELVTSGVKTLKLFERDLIPGEVGSITEQESGVVHKYPVRLRFEGNYNSFQKFVNSITNDKNFFYIIRVLKVENEVIAGPLKLTGEGGSVVFVNSASGEPALYDDLLSWGLGTASDEDMAQAASAAGYVASNEDARVIFGQELLEVYMVVDIARFLSPEEVANSSEKQSNEESSKRR